MPTSPSLMTPKPTLLLLQLPYAAPNTDSQDLGAQEPGQTDYETEDQRPVWDDEPSSTSAYQNGSAQQNGCVPLQDCIQASSIQSHSVLLKPRGHFQV